MKGAIEVPFFLMLFFRQFMGRYFYSIGLICFHCPYRQAGGKDKIMKKIENQQTSSNKQYRIPMEVTKETIRDYGINPTELVWTKIGNRRVRALMVPVTEEIYYEFMRPLWREDKRNQRAESIVSIDKLYDEDNYEIADDTGVEDICMKKLLIDELHRTLDELDEMDRIIMTLFSNGGTESEIGKVIGMSQKGVNKRKHKILGKLKERLKDFR